MGRENKAAETDNNNVATGTQHNIITTAGGSCWSFTQLLLCYMLLSIVKKRIYCYGFIKDPQTHMLLPIVKKKRTYC